MKKYLVGLILASLVFLPLAQASYFQKPAGVTAEIDPVFSASPASNSTLISHWNTAYAYGNHATMGYLTVEVDPVFAASNAAAIMGTNISDWNTAYAFGNHAAVGYLTTESDPVYSASNAATITAGNITQWNTAYAYGNHASVGYLTVESDPIYSASNAATIMASNIDNWNQAYAFGNHASVGYLTAEVDGSVTNELQNLFGVITSSSGNVSASSTNSTLLVTGSGIVSTSIVGNNLIIEGTIGGNATSFFGVINTDSTSVVAPMVNSTVVFEGRGITSVYADGNYSDRVVFESIETDPVYSGDPAFGITANDIVNWNIAYAFGNHAAQSYAYTTGNTFSGVHDFGGATSVEVPNGANPTVDAFGEVAIDSTVNQFLFYGNTTYVLSPERSLSVTIPSLANTDDNFLFWVAPSNVTITKVGCKYCGTGTTPATIALEDDGGNAMTHGAVTCVNQGTVVTFVDVTAANALISGEGLRFDVTNTPNPATDNYTIAVVYTTDRQ